MTRRSSAIFTGALGLALLAARADVAGAHQFWLYVSDHVPKQGEKVDVGACSGTGFRGEARPWANDRCIDFSWYTYRRFALTPVIEEGVTLWAQQAFMDTAGGWVQYRSNFAAIELPPAEFDQYLTDEGLDGPLQTRSRIEPRPPGRERYRRCCKAWIEGLDERRATRPLGHPLELVPRSRPGAAPELRVRVLWQGRPLAGVLVKTWCQPLTADGRTRPVTERDSVAVTQQMKTDANGEVRLDVRSAGEWLLSAVHMVPAPAGKAVPGVPEADWESTWASLTFARLEADTTRRAAP